LPSFISTIGPLVFDGRAALELPPAAGTADLVADFAAGVAAGFAAGVAVGFAAALAAGFAAGFADGFAAGALDVFGGIVTLLA
jgi:hypothetical protein